MPYVMRVSMTGAPLCPGCEQHRDEVALETLASLGTVGCSAATASWLDRLRIRRRRRVPAVPTP
jgi:hypothetical protein